MKIPANGINSRLIHKVLGLVIIGSLFCERNDCGICVTPDPGNTLNDLGRVASPSQFNVTSPLSVKMTSNKGWSNLTPAVDVDYMLTLS